MRRLRLFAVGGLAVTLLAIVATSSTTTTCTATAVIEQAAGDAPGLNTSIVRAEVTTDKALASAWGEFMQEAPIDELRARVGVAAAGTADRPQQRIAVRVSADDAAVAERVAGDLAAAFVARHQSGIVGAADANVKKAAAAVNQLKERIDSLRRQASENLERQIELDEKLGALDQPAQGDGPALEGPVPGPPHDVATTVGSDPAGQPASGTGTSTRWIPNPEWSALSAELEAMKARRLNLLKSMTDAHPLVRQSQQRIETQIARMEGVPEKVLAPEGSANEGVAAPIVPPASEPVPAGVAYYELRQERLAIEKQLAGLRREHGRLERQLAAARLEQSSALQQLTQAKVHRRQVGSALASHVTDEVVTTKHRATSGPALTLSLLAGLAAGLLLAGLSWSVDRTFADSRQVEAELGVPVLATLSSDNERAAVRRKRQLRSWLARVGWGAAGLVAACAVWMLLLALADAGFRGHLAASPVQGFLESVERAGAVLRG